MPESELPWRYQRIVAFMRLFFEDEDQLPTLKAMGARFGFSQQESFRTYQKLMEAGVVERNVVGKYRWKRAEEQET